TGTTLLRFTKDLNHDFDAKRLEGRPIPRSLCGTPQGRGKARHARTRRVGDGNRFSNHPARDIRHHRNSSPRERRWHGPHSLGHLRSSNHGCWTYFPWNQLSACHLGEVSGDGLAPKSLNDSNASFKTARSSIDPQPCACLGNNLDCHLWNRISLLGDACSMYFV